MAMRLTMKSPSVFFGADSVPGVAVSQTSFERTIRFSHIRTKCIVKPETVFEVG
jgi:hypothetical protein